MAFEAIPLSARGGVPPTSRQVHFLNVFFSLPGGGFRGVFSKNCLSTRCFSIAVFVSVFCNFVLQMCCNCVLQFQEVLTVVTTIANNNCKQQLQTTVVTTIANSSCKQQLQTTVVTTIANNSCKNNCKQQLQQQLQTAIVTTIANNNCNNNCKQQLQTAVVATIANNSCKATVATTIAKQQVQKPKKS